MTNQSDNGDHKRGNKRSLVLLTAKVIANGAEMEVRLRNLSQKGALLEADRPPQLGVELVFERGATKVKARVAWVSEQRFGIEFLVPIEESEVLVHVGRAKSMPTREPSPTFRRAGIRPHALSPSEAKIAAAWVSSQGRALGE
jgi:hypothetical protein